MKERVGPLICRKCGEEKQVQEFSQDRRRPGGISLICRRCDSIRRGTFRIDHIDSERARERRPDQWRRKWDLSRHIRIARTIANNKALQLAGDIRYSARSALRSAVQSGRVKKPTACFECGATNRQLHGHHEDYHRALDVVWLCPVCHGARHRKIRPGQERSA